jgi:hypothetical protein
MLLPSSPHDKDCIISQARKTSTELRLCAVVFRDHAYTFVDIVSYHFPYEDITNFYENYRLRIYWQIGQLFKARVLHDMNWNACQVAHILVERLPSRRHVPSPDACELLHIGPMEGQLRKIPSPGIDRFRWPESISHSLRSKIIQHGLQRTISRYKIACSDVACTITPIFC